MRTLPNLRKKKDTMPYAQVNSYRIFYIQTRSQKPDAPTLVLIHGAGGSHLQWPRELRRLPEATVFALDLPGHGRSDGAGCDTIEDYVDILVGFLDASHIERAVLAGHSMGGAIAQLAALTHPERVTALVLIGTGARLRVAPAILEGVRSNFENAVELISHFAWSESAPDDLVRLGHQILAKTSPDVIQGDFLACNAFDVRQRLNEINAPTLVISGTIDHLTPHKYCAYLAEHIPDARLVTVEGGGHMLTLEQPSVVANALSEFIRELS